MKSSRSKQLQNQFKKKLESTNKLPELRCSLKKNNTIPVKLSWQEQIRKNNLEIALAKEAILNSINAGELSCERLYLYEYRELLLLRNKELLDINNPTNTNIKYGH